MTLRRGTPGTYRPSPALSLPDLAPASIPRHFSLVARGRLGRLQMYRTPFHREPPRSARSWALILPERGALRCAAPLLSGAGDCWPPLPTAGTAAWLSAVVLISVMSPRARFGSSPAEGRPCSGSAKPGRSARCVSAAGGYESSTVGAPHRAERQAGSGSGGFAGRPTDIDACRSLCLVK